MEVSPQELPLVIVWSRSLCYNNVSVHPKTFCTQGSNLYQKEARRLLLFAGGSEVDGMPDSKVSASGPSSRNHPFMASWFRILALFNMFKEPLYHFPLFSLFYGSKYLLSTLFPSITVKTSSICWHCHITANFRSGHSSHASVTCTYQWSRRVWRNADRPSMTSNIAIVRKANGTNTKATITQPA